jgi:hypothetical protein
LPAEVEDYRLTMVGRLSNPRRFWVWYRPRWELPLADRETMLEVQAIIFDDAGREILPRQTVPPRPGNVRDLHTGQLLIGPNPLHALSGLATSPFEAAVLLGTLASLESGARPRDGLEAPLPLQFLGGSSQLFIPGLSWYSRTQPAQIFSFAGLMLVSCLICGLGCYGLPRRYAFSRNRSVAWAVCGLLFGQARTMSPTGTLKRSVSARQGFRAPTSPGSRRRHAPRFCRISPTFRA